MKFYSYAFGCRVNEAEKEALDQQMIKQGFVFDEKNPDLFIINTCAVTHKAEREARNLIYRLKRQHPKAKIVITGCSASYWQKNQLYQELPIDLLVDNQNKEFLTKIIKKRLLPQSKSHLRGGIWPVARRQEPIKLPIFSKFLSSARLLVKIQDGCHRFCTYCIVPYLRGLPKSYKIKNIVDYIQQNQKNISEVILTAINTEAFGQDTGEQLTDLIKTILKKTNVGRLSFGSIHPWSINKELVSLYQNQNFSPRLVKFFHVPIQSGSDKILSLMKRNYTIEEINEKLNSLEKINPYSLLATDIIVGFLDEEQKDFEQTYNFLEKSPLVKFHVFRFSKRKNTAAFFMAKTLKEPTADQKKQRAQALIKLSAKKFSQFQEKNLSRKSYALILNKQKNNHIQALLDNQLPIWLKKEPTLKPGQIVLVKVDQLKKDQLFGKLIK